MDRSVRQRGEDEDLLLAHEASHRIKNDLQILRSWISGAEREAIPPADIVAGVQARIGVIARLYDRLSVGGAHLVDLEQELEALAADLAELVGRKGGRIRITVRSPPALLPAAEARLILLLAHEGAVNAVQHAFPDGVGRVEIVFHDGPTRQLIVRDDGVGKGPPSRHGLGSLISRGLAERLGGCIVDVPRRPRGLSMAVTWPSARQDENFDAGQRPPAFVLRSFPSPAEREIATA